MVMLDSGNKISNGVVAYHDKYSSMVNTSMARLPKAEVRTFWVRQGDQVKFMVQVKNLSGTPLSWSNGAAVHAIVYEDAHVGATNRFVRSAIKANISNLADGSTATFTLQTPNLSGVDWNKLHYIALVDNQPSGPTKAADMLQADIAQPSEVHPAQLVFMIDNDDADVPSQYAQILAPHDLTWNASGAASWLSVNPASGNASSPPEFSVIRGELGNDWQQTVISISSPDGFLSDQVTVKAFLGEVTRLFLPMMAK